MLLVGVVLAWRDPERRHALGASTALALGAVLFAALLGLTRFGLGERFAASSRYLHIGAALVLPLLAVAADALARRWRAATPVVLVLLVVGVPGNIADVGRNVGPEARYREYRRTITALSGDPLVRSVPRDLHPTPSFAADVTAGWLVDGERDGRIPAPPRSTAEQRATDKVRLSLEQVDAPVDDCRPLRTIVTRRLAVGESVGIAGAVTVQAIPGRGPRPQPLPFGTGLLATSPTHVLRALAEPLTLRIAPRSLDAALC